MDTSLIVDQVRASFTNQFLTGGLGLMILGYAGYILRKVPKSLWNGFLRYGTVLLEVESNDTAYDWFLFWLDSQPYGKRSRRVAIKHIHTKGGHKTILVPARGNHWFIYKRKPMWLSRVISNDAPSKTSEIADLFKKEVITIRTLGRSRQILDDLVNNVRAGFETITKDMLIIKYFRYGNWYSRFKTRRPMESVFLPDSSINLLDDMRKFIANKDWYRQMGLPHRRGYLFSGPPGTGKSCSAEAIAGELDIPAFVLNTAGLSDNELQQAILGIDNGSVIMLLIEDIDTVPMSREQTEKNQRLSLGTVLNVLDGIQAAESVILIITTNRPEALDAALLRKGRIDVPVTFGYATPAQIEAAAARILGTVSYEQAQAIALWETPIAMADVQEKLVRMALGE